jgi:hypothetical protein
MRNRDRVFQVDGVSRGLHGRVPQSYVGICRVAVWLCVWIAWAAGVGFGAEVRDLIVVAGQMQWVMTLMQRISPWMRAI